MTIPARLDRLPLCRPHYLLLVIGGLGYTFDGMDAAIVAFLLPSARTEWGLSSGQLGLVGSASPFGFLFGAVLAGALGDRIGRKKVMMYALLFYCVFTLIAAAAPTYETFLTSRVLAGLGTGAESAIIAPFLSEFVPANRRGWFIGALAGFFSFGFVGAAVLGRLIVPTFDGGWRWVQVITAVPILLVLWWRRSLPESSRYLLLKGRTEEAERVVTDFEARAERATGRPLPPVPAPRPEATTTEPHTAPTGSQRKTGFGAALQFLWGRDMASRTAVVWTLWFVITFSYYGFFSWIPTLLIDRGITVTKSFSFSIIIYLAQIPGYFSAAWLNERADRKNTIAAYLVGSAVSAFALSQMNTPVSITIAGAFLSFFLVGVYAGLYSYTPEVFPTWVRATGTGLASAFGRVGSITAPVIIGFFALTLGFAGVFTMTTAVLAVGVLVVLVFGLSTAGRSLEELTEPEGVGGVSPPGALPVEGLRRDADGQR